MKRRLVIDTMALVLRLEHRRCPTSVRQSFQDAESGKSNIYIPAMVLAEIGYLSERGRIETTLQDAIDYCAAYPGIEVVPLTQEMIKRSFEIDDISELHDRLITGTAVSMELPLITNDPVISDSKYVTVIW